MSAQPTAKRVAADDQRLALVIHPNTPKQRALETVNGARVDQMSAAVRRALATHPGAPLGWLIHSTGAVIVPILPTTRSDS